MKGASDRWPTIELEVEMDAYSLKSDEGWTHNLGIDFTVKAASSSRRTGAAAFECVRAERSVAASGGPSE